MSRRCFLATSTTALAATTVGAVSSSDPKELGEYVELTGLRPKPNVQVTGVCVREKPPVWLGWPGTSYDIEKYRAEYEKTFAGYADELGVSLNFEKDVVESDDGMARFVNKVKAQRPDALLISLQSIHKWKWVYAIADAGIPTIVFAPVGTVFTTTHDLQKNSRKQGIHVISSLETSAVKQALRMVRAKRQMEESCLLVVAGDKRKETVLERLGTTVKYIPRNNLHELFARMPENDEVKETAYQVRRQAKKRVEPNKQDTLNSMRSFTTAKRLMTDEGANAITTDCLGMVTQRVVPTPPCMGASIFQDNGVTYGCEADVFAAISLMVVSYLFDKPGFMQDPVPETVKNVLIGAHCSCGTRLKGFDEKPEDLILRDHSESALGVSTQVIWEPGQPISMLRFSDPNSLILDTGTVVGNVDTPPAGGCRTSLEVEMDRVEDARDVLGFHQAFFYGQHRRDVQAFAQMYGIKVVNSDIEAEKMRG